MIERTPLRAVFKNVLLLASPAIDFVKNTGTMISHFNAEKDYEDDTYIGYKGKETLHCK